MEAFNGDAGLKAALLAEVKKHRLADQIISGSYGDDQDWRGGCAVGCSLHSYATISGDDSIAINDHSAYERFGIPVLLARLEDRIFEGLPKPEQQIWPERFLSAPNPGADLMVVWPKLAVWMMLDPDYGVLQYAKTDAMRTSIIRVADAYATAAAAAGATATATATAYATTAATAYADAAAAAAAAADAAAYADAYAYADAAAYAGAGARKKYFMAMSDKLITLMQAAK